MKLTTEYLLTVAALLFLYTFLVFNSEIPE